MVVKVLGRGKGVTRDTDIRNDALQKCERLTASQRSFLFAQYGAYEVNHSDSHFQIHPLR